MGRMKRGKILILSDAAGAGDDYHVGDDAMAQVAIGRLKEIAGARNLVLLCRRPGTAGSAYGVKAIKMPMHTVRTWGLRLLLLPVYTWFVAARLLWHLCRARVVFKAGGGNMKGGGTHFPLLTLAGRLHKHVFLVSQTIGPLADTHRAVLRRALAGADWIGVRDRVFSGRQLGLPVRFAVDDAVFLTPRHDAVTAELAGDPAPKVGVSYRLYLGLDAAAFGRLLAATEDAVLDLGATPIIIPHHARRGGGDLQVAREIEREWRRVKPVVLARVPPAEAVLALTGQLALVLASRYHAVIFALAAGVPVVAVYLDEYTEAKMRGAFEQFELAPSVLHIRDARAHLQARVQQALAGRDGFAAAAARVRRRGIAANMAPYEALRTLLTSR